MQTTSASLKGAVPTVAAWIGLDWADQQHVGCLYDVASGQQESFTLECSAEAIPHWLAQLRQRYGGRRVAIVLEQRRGALIHALLGCEFVILYPINPQSLAKYRQAYFSSGAKSDAADAPLLMELVRHRPDRFHPWQPDDPETRSLQLLTEARRRWVDQQTALTNQLTQLLKGYYPQALELAGELSSPGACQFLKRWPPLAALQQARPSQIRKHYQTYGRLTAAELEGRLERIRQAQPLTRDPAVLLHGSLMLRAIVDQLLPLFATLRQFERQIAALFAQHPDRPLFDNLPGAGKVLSPRLLAAFGTQRDRWQKAGEVLTYWGIAPVTEQSGRSRWVHWRLACPKFLRQSWHEFAAHSRKHCGWAKAFYHQLRARGKGHHAALRALAYKWIRILFRCWQTHTPYDEQVYLNSLKQKNSALLTAIAALPSSSARSKDAGKLSEAAL
jgi:transposase